MGVLLRVHGNSSGSVPTALHTNTHPQITPHALKNTPHSPSLVPTHWENLHSSEDVQSSSQIIDPHSHRPFPNSCPSEVESTILDRKRHFQGNKSQARGTQAEKGTGKADPRAFLLSLEVPAEGQGICVDPVCYPSSPWNAGDDPGVRSESMPQYHHQSSLHSFSLPHL